MELTIQNLTKIYGSKVALREFSYTFTPGIYGILGANGAGKSTLMNLITDNVKRDSGSILWNGTDILRLGRKFRREVGYMPQQQGMYPDYSARDFLCYMAAVKELPRKESQLQIEELLAVVNLSEDAHKRLGGFSGGMRQRVLLAQALLGDPKILILDEPTNHLDLVYQKQIFALIRQWLQGEGRAVISVVHDLSLARAYGTHALLLDKANPLAYGTTEDVFLPENLNKAYRMDVRGWMQDMLGQWQ